MWFTYGNGKMLKTTDDHRAVIAWGIIAGEKTCPNADACRFGCYAMAGNYLRPNVKAKLMERYELTQSGDMVRVLDAEIRDVIKKKYADKDIFIRVHDTGDFYSEQYLNDWFTLARLHPDITFYCYTKMITMFKAYDSWGRVPANFKYVQSYGGKEDKYIDTTKAHARVFENVDELTKAGYVDCSKNDLLALTTDKVGLVYHGSRKWTNTGFITVETP